MACSNHLYRSLCKPKRLRIAGLMSGTSADGIDTAVIEYGKGQLEILAFETVHYPASVRKAIFRAFEPGNAGVREICDLNFLIGELFAQAVITTCRKHRIALGSLDLIGSHGQTMYHNPAGTRFGSRRVRSTLQIGEPSVIAAMTGITTIADFRPADIAAGGEGAPLVPFTDHLLFSHKRRNRVIQNIGGIANATWLKAGGTLDEVLAFDTGPGNMIIDALVSIATGGARRYDKDGRIAARGRVDQGLLNRLMRNAYFKRQPPKSTGRELFGFKFAETLYKTTELKQQDLIATATAFTARSIAQAHSEFLPDTVNEVILCGGGARNPALVAMLAEYARPAKIITMDALGINADAKEAVSFAILAWCTYHGIAGNCPTATGAKRPAILGKIVPGHNP